MFDRQGRMVKPARDRDENDLVRKSHLFFSKIKPKSYM